MPDRGSVRGQLRDEEQMCVCGNQQKNLWASSVRGLWTSQFKGYSMCVCGWLTRSSMFPPVLQIYPENVFFSINRRTEGLHDSFHSPLCSPTGGGKEISGTESREIIREIRKMLYVAPSVLRMWRAHMWTHACMKYFLQACLQVQQSLLGRCVN